VWRTRVSVPRAALLGAGPDQSCQYSNMSKAAAHQPHHLMHLSLAVSDVHSSAHARKFEHTSEGLQPHTGPVWLLDAAQQSRAAHASTL